MEESPRGSQDPASIHEIETMDQLHQAAPARGPAVLPAERGAPPEVPGYEVLRVLGQGGMGIVWEAIEHRLDRRVALKVHAGADGARPERVAQLWAEARLAAKIAHPGVVPVHDVGFTIDGSPYYTMDVVEGTSLRALLREGKPTQARAFTIAVDIAETVAAAHERGVIHCDLKPSNVLIDSGGRVRILDFGLAIRLGDEPCAPFDVVRGSPPYMSPEQAMAATATPASDVYAIGVILYEMLTGSVPFSGTTMEDLLHAVIFLPPVAPSARDATIPADAELICLRCLAKEPAGRFSSAGALVRALSALREGRPIEDAVPPSYAPRSMDAAAPPERSIPTRDAADVHCRWSWKLRASPEQLWPYVADTERFNRAVGLPEVTFEDSPDPRGGARRTGQFRLAGMSVKWDEHPFEWVSGREHSVFRDYKAGPFRGLWNRVQLLAAPGGGTELIHEVWVSPKGIVGRLAAYVELRVKAAKSFERVYRHLDEFLMSSDHEGVRDPFEDLHHPTPAQREQVERGARRLVDERRFPKELVVALTSWLLHAPSKSIERLRPYALAARWGHERAEVLDLFLHAASAGLVEIAWDLVCPVCLVPHETASALSSVASRGSCAACTTRYDRDLAQSVELIFRPHRAVRETTTTSYCAGAPALRSHVVAQQALEPGERREFVIALGRGDYRIAGARFAQTWEFSASAAGFASHCEVHLAEDGITGAPSVLGAGKVRITIHNGTTEEQIFRVEGVGERSDAVTAVMAVSHPTFHDFFSDELVAYGEHLAVSRMAFLFVDLGDRAALLERQGDAGAFSTFQRLGDIFLREVRAHQGAIVEVAFNRSLAAFPASGLAASAALAVQQAARVDRPGSTRAAVHEGRCIAVTRGGRIDYFGETIERGAALLELSPPGGVALSSVSVDDRAAAAALHRAGVTRDVILPDAGPFKGQRVTTVRAPGD